MMNNQLDLILFVIEHLQIPDDSEILTEFSSPAKQNAYLNYVLNTTKSIIAKFNNIYTTKLSCDEIKIAKNDQSIMVTIYGGLNGHGEFSKYLETIRNVISAMESMFNHVCLISLTNDAADDVFYLTLSIIPYIEPEIENQYGE